MEVIVFEDEYATRLYPVTIGRPAYTISCGGYRLFDWLRSWEQPLRGIVREHLAEIQRVDYSPLEAPSPTRRTSTLLVNARLVPSYSGLQVVRKLMQDGRPGIVDNGKEVAVALLPPEVPPPTSLRQAERLRSYFDELGTASLQPIEAKLSLFQYPHDIIRYHLQILAENLQHRIASGNYEEVADGVFVGEGVTLGQHLVTDTRNGPIVLESRAAIGPHCYMSGPVHVAAAARVTEHAALKDAVAIGHTTKIGGEVEASVIEPYTNKQHYGFMGHSYLGSWINLGAGTCNSDLKNTYGQVNMDYQNEKVATGMQFVGCIIGDYAKTAINTGIFTGKTIGACSMVYGFVTTNVPSFVNYARLFGQVTEMPPEVMIATQQRMFARRSVAQRPCDIQLLRDMYQLTRNERQMAGEPLQL